MERVYVSDPKLGNEAMLPSLESLLTHKLPIETGRYINTE